MSSHLTGTLFSMISHIGVCTESTRKFGHRIRNGDLFSCENRINVMCIRIERIETVLVCGFIRFAHGFTTFPNLFLPVPENAIEKAFYIQSSNRKYDHRLIIPFHVCVCICIVRENENVAHRIYSGKDSTLLCER